MEPVQGMANPCPAGLTSTATVTDAIGCAPASCQMSAASDPSPVDTLDCSEYGRLEACCMVGAAVPWFAVMTVHPPPLGSSPSSKSTQVESVAATPGGGDCWVHHVGIVDASMWFDTSVAASTPCPPVPPDWSPPAPANPSRLPALPPCPPLPAPPLPTPPSLPSKDADPQPAANRIKVQASPRTSVGYLESESTAL